MSFSVRIASADHRRDVFAEVEFEGELIAEVFADGGTAKVAIMDAGGDTVWIAHELDFRQALERARLALRDAGLLE